MSERGVFAVDRGIWEHDLLADSEPFSRREAWLWLLSEAAWKPHRRRIIGRSFDLQRGQLVASCRFIASKWRWSEARVRRFLAALVTENMIDATSDAGVNVITICKYDEYQRVSLPTDAMCKIDNDAGATQERRKVEDKEDKEIQREAGADAPQPKRAKKERKNATALSSDFQPDWMAATKVGLSRVEAEREFQKFKNWATAKGQTYVDWQAAWRNWCINAARYLKKPPPQSGPSVAMTIMPTNRSWNAWKAHFRDNGMNGRASIMDRCADEGRPFTVLSEWPPGCEVSDAA